MALPPPAIPLINPLTLPFTALTTAMHNAPLRACTVAIKSLSRFAIAAWRIQRFGAHVPGLAAAYAASIRDLRNDAESTDPSYAVLSTLLATPDESDAVLDWIAEHIKLIWFPGVVVPGPGLDGFGDVMTRAEEWLVQCAVHPDADGDGHVGRIFWEECGIGRGRTSRASF